ncbi:hypothetical protein JCM8547_007284 [Rhodosporidiobolus lusitaniae]
MAPAPRGSAAGQLFKCPDCTKEFSRKEYMARHHRSKHSKERPFQCEHCERGFSRSDLLKRHYQTCQEAKKLRAKEESGSVEPAPVASTSTSGMIAAEESNELPVPPAPSAAPAQPFFAPTSESFIPTSGFSLSLSSPAGFDLNIAREHSAFVPYRHEPGPSSLNTVNSTTSTSETSASPDSFQQTSPASTSATTTNGQSPDSCLLVEYQLARSRSQSQASTPASTSLPTLSTSLSTQQQQPHLPVPPTQTLPLSLPPQHQPSLAPSLPSTAAPSAFGPGNSNATLFPGLSGSAGSFTQDEVLASEVLRDLMRSPFGSSHGGGQGGEGGGGGTGLTPGEGGVGGGAGGEGGPWHGAKVAAGREAGSGGNESSSLVSTSGGDSYGYFGSSVVGGTTDGALTPSTAAYLSTLPPLEVDNKLENSPAAKQLASYFNAGGVGGITALDLGFPTEPSLFPDFLFQTPIVADEEDQKFYFCLGYLYPWHVPPLQTLSTYARTAATKLLPSVPLLHVGSVNMSVMPSHTAFALTVAGGAYEKEGYGFSNEMLVEKRVFLVRGFQTPGKSFDEQFATLQSLLLYQLLGLFHREEQQRLLAQSFHSAQIFMWRALDLPLKIRQTPVPDVTPLMQGAELEEAWKAWVKVETWRRVCFIVFLTDLEHSTATKTAQHLSLSDMDLDLPSSDRLWESSDAITWQARATSGLNPPRVAFLTAIRALMAREVPSPFSEEGVLLAELGRLSSFPLLILSRTLSFLERKTEEALAQIDPFRNLLGGLGVVEDREQENRGVLKRIKRGREVLRKLPGGIARGGGERWFQDVMPTARDFDTSASSSPSSSTSPSTASSFPTPSSTSVPLSNPSIVDPPAEVPMTLDELLAEFDEQPYKPYHGLAGAVPGESYEAATERMRQLREKKTNAVAVEFPFLGVSV